MLYIKENYDKLWSKVANTSSYGNPTDLIVTLADIVQSGTVLDLGAGDGRQAIYLASRGFKVTAVDISESGLQKLQTIATEQQLHIQTEIADIHSWSIPQAYNAIVAIAVLQHLKHDSALRILREMKTHTLQGGAHALTVFTQTGDRYALDKIEDPESFYPKDNWLQDFYGDWDIVKHDIITTSELRRHPSTGLPLKNNIERILAVKP